jgi:hypothetical protein
LISFRICACVVEQGRTEDVTMRVLKRLGLRGDEHRGRRFERRGGGVREFVRYLAERYPRMAARLLERMLPLSLNATTATSAVSEVRIFSVPPNC